MNLEQENTLRILKDEPRIQKLRCRLGFHRWVEWVLSSEGFHQSHCADCQRPHYKHWIKKSSYPRPGKISSGGYSAYGMSSPVSPPKSGSAVVNYKKK